MSTNAIQVRGDYERYEATSGGSITPGHLVMLNSSGNVVVHSTAGGIAEAAFAVEDALQGNGITDVYASGVIVQYNLEAKGSVVYGRIKDGETIVVGDKLVSAGNGELQKYATDSSATVMEQCVIGISLDAVDMSDSSAADPDGLCRVRIL